MKHIKLLGVLFTLMLFVECSKTGNPPSNIIVGQWKFTNEFSQSFPYPSSLINSFPTAASSWSISSDSIKVNFDNNGNYSFLNFRLPIARGTYKIVHDSLLVIKPDTSDFVKFCYTIPYTYVGSGIPQIILPYSNFHFTSDTILFKKTSNDDVVFTTVWLSKAITPIQPNQDKIVLNKLNLYFKKL